VRESCYSIAENVGRQKMKNLSKKPAKKSPSPRNTSKSPIDRIIAQIRRMIADRRATTETTTTLIYGLDLIEWIERHEKR
jgi:hypothetical protein